MKEHLKEIGEKKFLLYAILFCFFGDLILARFLFVKFADRQTFNQMLQIALAGQGAEMSNIASADLDATYALIVNTLLFFLTLMILLHLINYFFFSKKKSFAFRYVTALVWVGSPSCIMLGLSYVRMPIVSLIFIVQGLLYGYVARGLWNYPWDKTKTQER